jgi:hypothetical protein
MTDTKMNDSFNTTRRFLTGCVGVDRLGASTRHRLG